MIIPYFGKWPIWFEATMVSMAGNPSIHWLCPTDCELPENHPDNLKFLPITLKELNLQVNSIVGANVPLTPRKFCDLKPAYGDIFSEFIKGYDFWGICDMDIIWGDIRTFITKDILDKFDIISSRKEAISGHFNLFRNTQSINQLYKSIPNYEELFENPKFQWTDEVVLTNYIKEINSGQSEKKISVYWQKILCNQENGTDSHQEYYLDRWLWKKGKMLEIKNGASLGEIMYLHFINWKRTFRYCNVNYPGLSEFFISYRGIHLKPHTTFQIWLNHLKNCFFGYNQRLKRLRFKKRIQKKLNHITRKVTP